MRRDQLAIGAGRLGSCIDRRADRADVAANACRHESVADLHLSGQGHIRSLAHRVGGFAQRDKALGLDQAKSLHVVIRHLVSTPRRLNDYLNNSRCVAWARSQALPSSVSMWTSSFDAGASRTSKSSNKTEHVDFT